jgi:hypothetical protein
MSEAPKKEISRLTEARNEAEMILSAVERAPKSQSWQQLSGGEQSAIAEARDRLVVVKQGEDMAAIRDAIHALDQATQRFAELMIESAVQTAIHGRN